MGIAIAGLPGATSSAVSSESRNIFKRIDGVHWGSQLVIISGADSRDPSNASHPHVLRAGLVMAKDAADGKYKTAILGVTTVNYVDGGVTLTVGVATATEINRRYGTSGASDMALFYDVNADADSGPANVERINLNHSAVDTSAGTITIQDLNVNVPAGSPIVANEAVDYDETADDLFNLLIVAESDGIRVTDENDSSVDVTLDRAALAGDIDTSMIVFYDALQSNDLRQWLKDELNHGRQFIFSDDV